MGTPYLNILWYSQVAGCRLLYSHDFMIYSVKLGFLFVDQVSQASRTLESDILLNQSHRTVITISSHNLGQMKKKTKQQPEMVARRITTMKIDPEEGQIAVLVGEEPDDCYPEDFDYDGALAECEAEGEASGNTANSLNKKFAFFGPAAQIS